ncbi:restriction endonuclease subunit S [Pseudomonas sp. PDM18]|uniref:restriction endonuclease subunit S n=1 Tax=Pseudomonas sp. PDM18 TaxID=2769253 RepID=UPI00177E0655|nr:restriction endonuclease subunit S [Pseudomonas sp. PDM18]MBD9675645.1 restriction endonuclease subunit S [Pseudomonas sp. PDM18]
MSLPRYSGYKDSGVEWIGCIPAHWTLPKLKHFTRFTGGGTPNREERMFWGGEIPWVSPKDMKSELIHDSEERITDAGLANSSTTLVAPNKVLLVVRSGILKHTIPVAINAVPVSLNQDMKALEFKSSTCNSGFFLRWVQGLNDSLLLAWAKQGATVESIEHSYLSDTVVPLPPFEEQTAIAAFLDRETAKIDVLIGEQEKLIALLAEKRQATISHAVTRGLNPNAPMKSSNVAWLGEIPAHWTVCAVRRVVERIEQGWSPECFSRAAEQGEWGVLKAGCVNGGIFRSSENKALPDTLEPDANIEVRDGDLLMSRASGSPALVGSVAYVSEPPSRLMLSDKIFRLHLSCDVDSRFFAIVFSARYMRLQIEQAISGAEGLANNLPQSSLKGFTIAIPPKTEQVELVAMVEAEMEKLISLAGEAERAIALLKEHRSALITAAVTGQIDVRGLVKDEAA